MCIAVGGEGAHRWASKRAIMTAARPMVMATATKRAMATNHDNTGTGNGKEGGEQATVGRLMERGNVHLIDMMALNKNEGG
jgi:hypothetical protein